MNKKLSRYRDVFGHVEFLSADFSNFVYPKHVHETFSIGVIETGAQQFVTKKGGEIMPAGKLCVIDPDIVHEGWKGAPSGWRYRMFYPSVQTVARALDISIGRADRMGFGRFVIDDPGLFRFFRRFHATAMDGPDRLERDELAVAFLVALFTRHAGTRAAPTARHSIAAICSDYLDANLDSRVSIEDLSHLCGVSKTHVIRDFTRERGMSPYAFQIARRIERAKTLLSQGGAASEVALDCGFVDQSHMTRHFRRIVGTTPGRFAKAAM